MENYSRILKTLENIEAMPADNRPAAYRQLVDILWQNVPAGKGAFSEENLFNSIEFRDLENLKN